MKQSIFCSALLIGVLLLPGCQPAAPGETGEAPPMNDNGTNNTATENYGNEDQAQNDTPPSSDQDPMSDPADSTADFSQTAPPSDGDMIATIRTNMGSISIRLFPELVPKTVENFATHARNGYYDGIVFHRVMDNFMIQGGDPVGNGTGGESIWGGKFEDEFHEDLSNIAGSIAMANAGPDTNGSQFFINQVDNTYLDFDKKPYTSKHAVFGQVFEGFDVVEAIAGVQTNAMNKPMEDVVIETITISEF